MAEDAANEILDQYAAEDYVTFTITETTEERFRQEKRDRHGKRYRKLAKARFRLTAQVEVHQKPLTRSAIHPPIGVGYDPKKLRKGSPEHPAQGRF